MAQRLLRSAAPALLVLGWACASATPPATTPRAAAPPPGVAPAAPAPAPARTVDREHQLPQRLSDAEFWQLIDMLSEPDGYFRSDNLLSNEIYLQSVIPELVKAGGPNRVYLGVGPEQNFTYIAALRPAMAFIVDVRRGNFDLQMLYKALFEMSADRVDFVSRLFSRARPPTLKPDASIAEIFRALTYTAPDDARFQQNLSAVIAHLTKDHGFALTPADLEGIEYVYRAFQYYGPGLTYWMTGGGRFGRNAPTYADLMLATDEAGIAHSYLATDDNFRVMKTLEENNLLVPVVGNFAGPKALRSVGAYIRDHHGIAEAFYLSNVEQYLNMDGIWMDFCANASALPIDDRSVFIRAVRNGQYFNGVGLGQEMHAMKDDLRACADNAK